MIRDIRWAYELGFKRGWKVGNRRGRNASKPLIQSDLIKGSSSGTISCDTESTEERKFESYAEYLWRERTEELNPSDLETEVEQSDIRASATSDELLTDECRHVQSRMLKLYRGYQFIPNEYCPKCGEKL